jgi:hypothetical protein
MALGAGPDVRDSPVPTAKLHEGVDADEPRARGIGVLGVKTAGGVWGGGPGLWRTVDGGDGDRGSGGADAGAGVVGVHAAFGSTVRATKKLRASTTSSHVFPETSRRDVPCSASLTSIPPR